MIAIGCSQNSWPGEFNTKISRQPHFSLIFPFSSTITGCTPGNGKVAYVGFEGVTPARLEIRFPRFQFATMYLQ